jgi:hypothetical protein
VSGCLRTISISAAAWAFGRARPCSQFSSVRVDTRNRRANTARDTRSRSRVSRIRRASIVRGGRSATSCVRSVIFPSRWRLIASTPSINSSNKRRLLVTRFPFVPGAPRELRLAVVDIALPSNSRPRPCRGTTRPCFGCCRSAFCSARYASSSRYSGSTRVNRGVSKKMKRTSTIRRLRIPSSITVAQLWGSWALRERKKTGH